MRNSKLKAATALFAAVAVTVCLGTSDALARGGGGGGGHMGGSFHMGGGGGFHAGGGFRPGGNGYAHGYGPRGHGWGYQGGYYYGCNPSLGPLSPLFCL
jgi:hypothetical protein